MSDAKHYLDNLNDAKHYLDNLNDATDDLIKSGDALALMVTEMQRRNRRTKWFVVAETAALIVLIAKLWIS